MIIKGRKTKELGGVSKVELLEGQGVKPKKGEGQKGNAALLPLLYKPGRAHRTTQPRTRTHTFATTFLRVILGKPMRNPVTPPQ